MQCATNKRFLVLTLMTIIVIRLWTLVAIPNFSWKPRATQHSRQCLDKWDSEGEGTSSSASSQQSIEGQAIVRHYPCKGLKTLEDIMNLAYLPCNYIHDGFYLTDSNVALNEVYLTILELFKSTKNDPSKIIPIFVEAGGHDGITKSLSLKAADVCIRTPY